MTSTIAPTTHIDLRTERPVGQPPVILVCEHASHFIPPEFNNLGLQPEHSKSHAAWDPGALAVAQIMATDLNAKLVAGQVSRLVYDCNRPPDADDAMPARSEVVDIPGNRGLDAAARAARTAAFYEPFRAELAHTVKQAGDPVIVTIHSFTPVYNGQPRAVEIGILHDSDTRLADAMLANAASHTQMDVRRNDPYGPSDGVTHTLKEHAIPAGHLNVMLEIRNDLIAKTDQQTAMAHMIAHWVADAIALHTTTGAAK